MLDVLTLLTVHGFLSPVFCQWGERLRVGITVINTNKVWVLYTCILGEIWKAISEKTFPINVSTMPQKMLLFFVSNIMQTVAIGQNELWKAIYNIYMWRTIPTSVSTMPHTMLAVWCKQWPLVKIRGSVQGIYSFNCVHDSGEAVACFTDFFNRLVHWVPPYQLLWGLFPFEYFIMTSMLHIPLVHGCFEVCRH